MHGLSRITPTGNDNSTAAYMAVLSIHTYVYMLCSDDMGYSCNNKHSDVYIQTNQVDVGII